MRIDLSNLDAVDRLYCTITDAERTDSARELKARAKALGKMLAFAEVAGCPPDASEAEVVAKLRELAEHGWLRTL